MMATKRQKCQSQEELREEEVRDCYPRADSESWPKSLEGEPEQARNGVRESKRG